jgi:predicted esterase
MKTHTKSAFCGWIRGESQRAAFRADTQVCPYKNTPGANRGFWVKNLFLFIFFYFLPTPFSEARFFEVDGVRILDARQAGGRPCIEGRIHAGADTPLGKAYVRVYFLDALGKQFAKPATPSPAEYEKGFPATPLPLFLREGETVRVRVPLPEAITKKRDLDWRAVMVFGDERDATAAIVSPDKRNSAKENALWYDFPERALCSKESPQRPKNETRLMEIRCKTNLPDYPFFTLFARLPEGVKSGKEAQGVLCVCLLAGQVSEVRRALLNYDDAKGEVGEMIRYADAHKLLVLCWGSRRLWDPSKNWDQLPRAVAKQIDARFDSVAAAWENGVLRLSNTYGFARDNFLLWGFSGSAQYAMRLALRKPQYFNAVVLLIPSSFDAPTPEASKTLWCLATGELESGYMRSLRFYKQCRALNYRFIYKAVPGLGHQMHGGSVQLGKSFFDYARTLPKNPALREEILKKEMDDPLFWGDWLNQNAEKKENALFVPPALRVSLPTEALSRAWVMRPQAAPRAPVRVVSANKTEAPAASVKNTGAPPPVQNNASGGGEMTLFGKPIQAD